MPPRLNSRQALKNTARVVGQLSSGHALIERSLRLTLVVAPLLVGTLGLSLASQGGVAMLDGALVAIWGLTFGAVPVAWSTWLARTVPDEAESAGGLLVAAIQLAIATGAAVGGLIVDVSGVAWVFIASGSLLLAALVIVAGVQARAVAAA